MRLMYYAAYGSNLNKTQMQRRCPDATAIGTGWLYGWRLAFRGSKTGSYLTIEEDRKARTPVAIWKTEATDEARLDVYEGYPNFYYKTVLPVDMEDGSTAWAYAYIMHEDRPHGIPSEAYKETCRRGYADFRLDARVLEAAIADAPRRAAEDRRETE